MRTPLGDERPKGVRLNLKWRLTLVTALLIAIASTTIGIASYLTITRAQLRAVDATLELSLSGNPLGRIARDITRNQNPATGLYTPVAIALLTTKDIVTVIQPAGTDQNPEPFPNLPGNIRDLKGDETESFTDSVTGKSYRAIVRSAGKAGLLGKGGLLVGVTSLERYQENLNQVLASIILFVVGMTLAGALISWLVVRKFFKPVNEMIDSASVIASGDTSMRVPTAKPGTELAELATSLNAMINSLTSSISKVEESEQRLRSFVSDASHEIRTPLTVIRGYIEILLSQTDSDTPEGHIRALSRIESESRRLERLVTSLLSLESSQSRNSRITEFSLDHLIREHFADLTEISQHPVTLSLEPISLSADIDAWRQLLANMTQNIMRYTPSGSPVNVTATSFTSHATQWARVVVDDAGPGIPAENRTQIFDRFTRLDDSRATTSGGFGLGMSIMHAVVVSHGGTITLDDSPSGGLRITVEVPLTIAATESSGSNA